MNSFLQKNIFQHVQNSLNHSTSQKAKSRFHFSSLLQTNIKPPIIKINAILTQLQKITNNQNYTSHQSAYRPNHSTETAHLRALQGFDEKTAQILTSATYDTLDHNILIDHFTFEFGIKGLALKWLESYLTRKKQFVKLGIPLQSPLSKVFHMDQSLDHYFSQHFLHFTHWQYF